MLLLLLQVHHHHVQRPSEGYQLVLQSEEAQYGKPKSGRRHQTVSSKILHLELKPYSQDGLKGEEVR